MVRDYDPLRSPLELPVLVWEASLRFERPLELPRVAGASIVTSLRGALGTGLRAVACRAAPCCDSEGEWCAQAPGCAVPALWTCQGAGEHGKQGRTHPPAIAVTRVVPGGERLDARVVLWGRGAVNAVAIVRAALGAAGERGVHVPGGDSARFEVGLEVEHEGTVASWALARGLAEGTRVGLRFDGPAAAEGSPVELAALLGNAAHDLVQWDLFDRGADVRLGRRACDEHADAARAYVAALVRASQVEGALHQRLGERRASARTGRSYRLDGVAGEVWIEGELGALAGWLAVAELRGLGPRRSFHAAPELVVD